jgi:hypothetical protein
VFVAVTAYDTDGPAPPIAIAHGPSMNIVAMEDDTMVQIHPQSAIGGGNGIPAAAQGGSWTMMLNTGPPRVYRIFGAVDGTQLTYDPPGVGPATVNLGQMHEIRSTTPFIASSVM